MARILFSYATPLPDKLTGISIYAWRILEALVRHGRHDYVLATNWHEEKLPPAIRALGIPIVERTVPLNESRMLIANARDLPKLRKRLGASLIFHPQPTAMLWGMADSVVVLHDLYRVTHPELHSMAKRLQWQFGTAASFRRSGALVAVSNATRDAAVAAYPDIAAKTVVVHEASPMAVPDTQVRPTSIQHDFFGLMVANITPNKNVGVLFEALEMLAARGIRPRVALAGRDDIGALPDLFAKYPNAAVTAIGPVSDAELAALYGAAAAYINASLVEGFCLPILEAHSFGLPVICSDIPVLHEVAGEGAAFFDPRSPAALADAIARLYQDADYAAAMAARAQANATRFSWEKAAIETEAVFDTVLNRLGR